MIMNDGVPQIESGENPARKIVLNHSDTSIEK